MMAKNDRAADVDDETEEAPKPKKRSKVIKIAAIALGVLLVLSATVGISVYVTSKMLGDSSSENTDQSAETTEPAKDGKGGKAAKGAKADKNKNAKKGGKDGAAAIYFAFEPPMVVNFQQTGGSRFLQVTIEAMTHDPAVVTALQTHMPVIRNNLVFLLSNQSAERLMSLEGKQKVRAEALAEVQAVLTERFGSPGVEELYFTSFVMQ